MEAPQDADLDRGGRCDMFICLGALRNGSFERFHAFTPPQRTSPWRDASRRCNGYDRSIARPMEAVRRAIRMSDSRSEEPVLRMIDET